MNYLLILCVLFAGSIQAEEQARKIVTDFFSLAEIEINGKRPFDIQIHNEDFYTRVLRDRSLGLGESYMEGWWDAERLDECIYQILKASREVQLTISWKLLWAFLKAKIGNQQTRAKSLRVIEEHYQLGNDLYENMLDPLMTYSCGYWKKASTLQEAQEAKYDLIARKLGFKKGMRVLDIGCGWGGFAKYVATKYGVTVVGITLSENQAAYAREVCQNLPVEIRVQDYRDIQEKFDRIVEIGMFEHVGAKNYRTFMEIIHRSLESEGMVMLHTIGGNVSTLTTDPWLNKYIFPGGQLPSIAQIGKSIEGLFVMEDWHNFGPDYDKTLMAWYHNVTVNWPKIAASYPSYFYRMWKYYLLSCAAAFRIRDIQLWQVVLSKEGVPGGYNTVR